MKFIIFLSSYFSQFIFILNGESNSYYENQENRQLKAVYRIDSLVKGYTLTVGKKNNLELLFKKLGKQQNFRIIPSDSYGLYYIESKSLNKRIGLDDKNNLILKDKINQYPLKDTYWNITNINDNIFLIQNNYSQNYVKVIKNNNALICKNNLDEITNGYKIQINEVSDNFKFSFLKLFEEVDLKPEHISIIEKEPIDVLIKYIDLIDPSLNRIGIKKIKKDEEHEEFRYCVRGILEYIPWIRKIFILMPNKRVKYFKPIEEISDKFVYVQDKDLLGFESEDCYTYHFHLWKMKKFNLSENFILMDDDYFIGKPINKSQFFYYDEEQKKILPSIVTDDISEINKDETLNKRRALFQRRNSIPPHSFNGWKLQQLSAYKLLLDSFKTPLINGDFSHNAIPLNLNDLKEIYDFIKANYTYANETLFSKFRTMLGLQSQSLFNSYLLNVKKRKVNSIPYAYYDLAAVKNKNLDIELFVINTSGDRIYTELQNKIAKELLEKKFSKPTPYEIELKITKNDTHQNLSTTEYNNNKRDEKLNNETEKIKNEIHNIKSQIKEKDNDSLKIEKKEDIIDLTEVKKSEIKDKNYLFSIFYIIIIFIIIALFCTYFICIFMKQNIHKYKRNKIKKKNRKTKYSNYESNVKEKNDDNESERLANS